MLLQQRFEFGWLQMIGRDHPELQHFAAVGAVAFERDIAAEVLVGGQRRLARAGR